VSVPLYSQDAAAAVAGALLGAVPLPPDTERVTRPPGAVAGKLARPGNIDEAKAVDRYLYWSSTERPETMLALLAKDGPIHRVSTSSYGGTGGRNEEWGETLSARSTSPADGPTELFVAIVLDGSGHYEVRLDAAVAWHERRPAGTLVPTNARWLEVVITAPAYRALNPGEPSHAHTTMRSVITTVPSVVQGVARAVNELPVAEPSGPDPSCPAEFGTRAPYYRLTFRTSARARDLARVIAESGYVCERGGADTAKITTPEAAHGLQLTDHLNQVGPSRGEGLTEHIELAFHHTLGLVPES